jgi:hypothetical protein
MLKRSIDHPFLPTQWLGKDGMAVACEEKIKVLNENLLEIQNLCQQALEDAVLMGCSEHFVKIVLADMIASLEKPFVRM